MKIDLFLLLFFSFYCVFSWNIKMAQAPKILTTDGTKLLICGLLISEHDSRVCVGRCTLHLPATLSNNIRETTIRKFEEVISWAQSVFNRAPFQFLLGPLSAITAFAIRVY